MKKRALLFVFLFLTPGCRSAVRRLVDAFVPVVLLLLSGCAIQPMPANKVFGVSNPTLRAKVTGYGVLEIPTNFDGDFQFDKNPDSSIHLVVKVKSNAGEVVDAEGNRIPNMDAYRQLEAARIVEQQKAVTEMYAKLVEGTVGLATAAIPLATAGNNAAAPGPGAAVIEKLIERAIEKRFPGPPGP